MGWVHYGVMLPPELADLKGDQKTKKIIERAWFHRKSEQSFDDLTDEFIVEIDGCQVSFSFDSKRSGRYTFGSRTGQVWKVVTGTVLKLSPERQKFWEQKLKIVQVEMNQKINQELSKLPNNPLLNLPVFESGVLKEGEDF
jgi:hypothetical protein